MIIADHPYFALHWWNGRNLISHLVTAEEDEVLASFTPELQPLVRMLADGEEGPRSRSLAPAKPAVLSEARLGNDIEIPAGAG